MVPTPEPNSDQDDRSAAGASYPTGRGRTETELGSREMTDMPRILFMCSALGTGGAERQWSILIPGLAKRGFDVRLMTLRARGRFFEEIQSAGIQCQCVGLRSRWDLAGILRTFELARPVPQVIMTHEMNAQVLGQLIASRTRAAHVTVDHTPPGIPRGWHRRLLIRLVARKVDVGIAVSRSQLPELYELGFDRNKLRIIYNGVPALRPTRARSETRAALGYGDWDFVAVLVGALRDQKRVPVFIEAIAAAHAADPRIKGLVVGGGAAFPVLRALAAYRGSNVSLLGERDDVLDLIAASDVVCLTSWTEATPVALIEAMALERPVIAAAVGGNEEVVVHGETGILVAEPEVAQFADAFQELASEASRSRALGRAGKMRYERLFTAERMVDEYVDVLIKLAGSNGKHET
jgi:glycosyltransferase involved in cell wall biosynthesis